jgi:hypothetical protein
MVINRFQVNLNRNQSFHMNRWGLRAFISREPFVPVNEISYARPDRVAEWFKRQTTDAVNLGAPSVTASGISDRLVSHHTWSGAIMVQETMEMFGDAFAQTSVPINANNPNMYLWEHVDRYLQIPVLNSQYIISTDTVPFLQMVLSNSMEVYAPYSNFNFYTRQDALHMIDYNVFPSFVVTHQPAHMLGSTNSMHFFATEYAIYRDIILDVYDMAAPLLSRIKGLEWVSRRVLQNGVVLNMYSCGLEVVINYTLSDFYYRGNTIAAETALVFEVDG